MFYFEFTSFSYLLNYKRLFFFVVVEINFVTIEQFASALFRICQQNLAQKLKQVRENGLLTRITGFISVRLRKSYLLTVT